MKNNAIKLMRQDQRRAVVAVIVVKGEAVYDAGERGHDPGAGRSPDIDTEMEAAGFFASVKMSTTGVEGPVFVVAAETISGLVGLERAVVIVGNTFVV